MVITAGQGFSSNLNRNDGSITVDSNARYKINHQAAQGNGSMANRIQSAYPAGHGAHNMMVSG